MAAAESESPVRWRGETAEQRRARRREQLLDACFDLLGREGVAGVGVRAVCRTAGLSERYFYESYERLDDLIGETYERFSTELFAAMHAEMDRVSQPGSAKVEASVRASLRFLSEDPRRARVFLAASENPSEDHRSVPRRAELYRELIRAFDPTAEFDDDRLALTSTTLMGSQTQLFFAWASGRVDLPEDVFVNYAVGVFAAVVGVRADQGSR
jgi:AcrR family transcriptional regulator